MPPIATRRTSSQAHNHGSILLMVLVAIIIMTLATSSYMLLMRNEQLAARRSGNHLQAESLVSSGIEYLRVLLAQSTTDIELQGGLLNNPELLQEVLVIDDVLANYRGYFTVVAPDMSQGLYHNLRYGLENESAKLNINALLIEEEPSAAGDATAATLTARDRLLVLPGMDEAVADAILDWLDEDDVQRTYGAESSTYQSLTPAYLPRNGLFAQLDELLMIQGVTPELLYGVDLNRNYLADADELPRGALEQLDNSLGQLNRGWSAYLTVHSLESNVTPEGEPKIDVNGEDLQTLHSELQAALGPAEANFIIAYRQHGPADDGTSGDASSAEAIKLDFKKEAANAIDSLLSLIDARISIAGENNQPAQVIESPWKDAADTYRQAFAELLDLATVDPGERLAGRININLASRTVLLTLPGMTETLADQILSSRDPAVNLATGDQRHPTWLIAEGLITLPELKPMLAYMTVGGDVYSGQIVGYFEAGTARARAEVLLDRSDTTTRLIGWQDLSPLGPGLSRSVLARSALDRTVVDVAQ